MPPDVEELEQARIGLVRSDGDGDDHITAPPLSTGNGVVEAPVRKDEPEKIYMRVEIESEYPGGPNAWKRFLLKTLRYPEIAERDAEQGQVVVKFIVDTSGNVSDVEAISGPAELQAEAIRVITKSGKWTAAIQNGRKVRSYKHQPITFQLSDQ